MARVDFKDKKTGKDVSYYMDNKLAHVIDKKIIPSLQAKDKDCVIAIDGNEGAGKSTLALQIGKRIDPSLDLSRVVFSADEFKQAIFKAKKGQCIIYDEAFTGLSSRSSLSGINRYLVSLMMQMRQKNLMVIIVLPTFFLLDKYVAIWRTRALIHVYESGGRRGYFRVYNRKTKKMLFLQGRQSYSYLTKKIFIRFKGRFYGVFALGDEKEEEKYRKKKEKALEDTEKNPMTGGQVKYMEQRDILLYLLRKNLKMPYRQLGNYLNDYELGISHQQIAHICAKFGDLDEETAKKDEKTEEKAEITEKVDETEEKVDI